MGIRKNNLRGTFVLCSPGTRCRMIRANIRTYVNIGYSHFNLSNVAATGNRYYHRRTNVETHGMGMRKVIIRLKNDTLIKFPS